jgi:hypothetical protein
LQPPIQHKATKRTQPHTHSTVHRFTYYNDRYSPDKIQEKTKKYQGLINDIKARGWKVDPLIMLTTGAKRSTHKNTITKLKRIYTISKNLIEPMVSQLNIIAIKYSMNILLYKRKFKNNQLVPTIPN